MSVVAMRRVLLTLAAVGVLLLLSSMVAGAAIRAPRAGHPTMIVPPSGIIGTTCDVASGGGCRLQACPRFTAVPGVVRRLHPSSGCATADRTRTVFISATG